MSNLPTKILLALTLINLTTSTYRIIIIDNGYTVIDKRENIYELKKKFAALLFKTENYNIPSQRSNFEIYDLNNWHILDFKEFYSDLGIVSSFWSSNVIKKGFVYREYPISDMKIEIGKFESENIYSFERGFLENFSEDGSSVFSFYRLFSEDRKYQNSGFSLIMAKTEFSFLKNIYYMEDFNSEMDPSQINLEFTALKYSDDEEDTYENNKMNFKLKIKN